MTAPHWFRSTAQARPGVPRSLDLKQLALLVGLALAAFLPFVVNGFIWDDDGHVTPPALRGLSGLTRIWFEPGASQQYYPLVHTVFWLEYHTWGLNPFGYHLVNVLLHALSAVLLWRLLSRLDVPGALLGALLFAVHPMQVESVAWISELKNALSCVFYLLAAHLFVRFWELEGSVTGWSRWRFYSLALLCFVAALLSKTVTATLPAALLLVAWWKRPRFRWRDLLEVAPMFVLGAGMGVMTAWVERQFIGASGSDWDFSFGERVLIAGRVLWFYLGKLVWPHPMVFIYPRWTIDAGEWWQHLFPVAAASGIAALYFLRHRLGKGPLVAALLYAGTLVPALGFVNFYPMRFSFVANHFAYHALIGPMALLGALGIRVHERLGGRYGRASVGLGAASIAALLALTWLQVKDYADANTLWKAVLARNPKCWIAHRNLGQDAYKRGDFALAEAHLREVVRLAPHVRSAHYDHGTALERLGRLAEAGRQYELELAAFPAESLPRVNLAGILARSGNLDGAIRLLEEATRLEPKAPQYHFNLGLANEQSGRLPSAAEQYEKAARLAPDVGLFLENYTRVMAQLDELDRAAATLERIVAEHPGSAVARTALEKVRRLQAKRPKDVGKSPPGRS